MDKLVRIKDCTYNELAKRGKWSDTMDSIIQQLLQQPDYRRIDDMTKSKREEDRQRKKLIILDCDNDKNALRGALPVRSQKRQAAESTQPLRAVGSVDSNG